MLLFSEGEKKGVFVISVVLLVWWYLWGPSASPGYLAVPAGCCPRLNEPFIVRPLLERRALTDRCWRDELSQTAAGETSQLSQAISTPPYSSSSSRLQDLLQAPSSRICSLAPCSSIWCLLPGSISLLPGSILPPLCPQSTETRADQSMISQWLVSLLNTDHSLLLSY